MCLGRDAFDLSTVSDNLDDGSRGRCRQGQLASGRGRAGGYDQVLASNRASISKLVERLVGFGSARIVIEPAGQIQGSTPRGLLRRWATDCPVSRQTSRKSMRQRATQRPLADHKSCLVDFYPGDETIHR